MEQGFGDVGILVLIILGAVYKYWDTLFPEK